MTDMFVVTPYDVYTKKDFCEKKEQLAKEQADAAMAVTKLAGLFQMMED